MKYAMLVLAFVLGCIFASQLHARTTVRIGLLGTKVRTTDCGANITASRCGVQFNGMGGGCGEYRGGGCGTGGCGSGQAHPRCATCPQNGCVPCGGGNGGAPFGVSCVPNYGTHTQTQNCTQSFIPYVPAEQLQYGAQMRYRGF